MDPSLSKLSTNWTQVAGCNFSQALQLQIADPDVFRKPTLEKLVDEHKAILLNKAECPDNCELQIKLFPHYKIQSFSLVCDVNKLEIFQGQIKEYLETIYGKILDDGDDDQFKLYRYDVEVEKSGITELVLKFPSQSTEICFFGLILQTAPNPNGITTMLPQSGVINMDNVNSLLKNCSVSLTPASEKCKQLLELMEKTKQMSPVNANAIFEQCNINKILEQNMDVDKHVLENNSKSFVGNEAESTLRKCIDERFLELEERLNQRLAEMEQRHMEKLERILKILEK